MNGLFLVSEGDVQRTDFNLCAGFILPPFHFINSEGKILGSLQSGEGIMSLMVIMDDEVPQV